MGKKTKTKPEDCRKKFEKSQIVFVKTYFSNRHIF